jgi:hypothetical protein
LKVCTLGLWSDYFNEPAMYLVYGPFMFQSVLEKSGVKHLK